MSALCRPARSGNGLEEHRHRWSLSIRINLCRRFLRRHTFETATFSLGICSVLVATGQKTFDFSGDLDVATKIELKYSILGRHRRALLVGTVQIRL